MIMTKEETLKLVSGVALGCFLAACSSSQPTPELVDARRAYDQARSSNAAQLVPDQLLTAKQALDRAEAAHQDSAGSEMEKSMAYIAQRKAALAISLAGYAQAERDMQSAEQNFTATQGELLKSANQDVAHTRDALRRNKEQLVSEHAARVEAERKAAAAMASLQEIAKVKEESRGMVITLDGSVLFATGKTTLLAIAEDKLSKVAEVLQKQDDSKMITVEGHTDSVGSDEDNMRLSQGRADSVRSYLVSQGVPTARIKAVGRGESMPIADNKTPEGRANNRRVEIIVGN